MREEVDICIVGGGVVGLFCALEHVKANKSVRIIDKVYTGASRNNIGAVLLQGHHTDDLPFMRYSYQCWKEAAEEFGEDLGFEERGSCSIAFSPTGKTRLDEEAVLDKANGFVSEVLIDHKLIAEKLGVEKIADGIAAVKISEGDAILDVTRTLDGLRRQLVKRGARIWGSDMVTDVLIEGNKVIGVRTATGDECMAKETYVCAGVWSNRILEKVGVNLPMRPARSHIIELMPNGDMPNQLVSHRMKTGDFIFKYQRSGLVLATYTGKMDPAQATWSNDVDGPLVAWMQEEVGKIIPSLENATLRSITTISMAVTPDQHVYIGRYGDIKGLIIATGFNGKSYAYSAGVAKILAALVNGEDLAVDISHMQANISRFAATKDADDNAKPVKVKAPEPEEVVAPEPEEVVEPEPEEERKEWADPFSGR